MRYNAIAKTKKNCKNFELFEKKRVSLKFLKKNEFLPYYIRNFGSYKLDLICFSFVKIRYNCIFSGRSRNLIKEFKISRLCFKEYVSLGLFEGIKKSSW